jgi:23S rRNA (cytidine1920-2'-O)/16S rRNA (cytidine1409-2'-O)-methyltransferase
MNTEIVGRAELKLAGAVRAFSYDFRGKTVLDIGSSTGGFTELALRQGAAKVIAVEIGTKQMKAPLRFDPQVDLHEKTDFFDVVGVNKDGKLLVKQRENDGELVTRLQVDTVVADVSFVSLKKILAHVKRVVQRRADFLVMLKPQFEARAEQLNRGVVKNEKMRREIIRDFEQWLAKNGFVIIRKRDNEVVGKIGKNQERFYWLRLA